MVKLHCNYYSGGSFGQVLIAEDLVFSRKVILKVEQNTTENKYPLLKIERNIYKAEFKNKVFIVIF